MKKLNKKRSYLQGPKNILIALLLFLGGIMVLTKLTDYARQIKTVNYSTFLQEIEDGKVNHITVSDQDVHGEYKDGAKFETVIPYNPKNWDLLRQHSVDVTVVSSSGQMNIWYIIFLLTLGLGLAGAWYFFRQSRSSGSSGGNIFSFGKSKARMFMPSTIKVKFDSVAGVAEAKEELGDVIDFLRNPAKYRRLGAKIPRGVLLVGEPGNGKTLLAKAVAGEANCPFFSISGSDFIEIFVGVGASRVRDLFVQARKYTPSIIFIDELDAVGRHRGNGLGGGNDEREQTLNQLLTEMDGFQTKDSSIIVLAATNRPDVLDKALLRPGRFDRRVEVPYPDLVSREQILKVHARGVKINSEVNLGTIARGTPGFSGADLSNLINEAAIIASKNKQDEVTIKDFEDARDKILLGKEVKSIIQSKDELRVTAYHESGHALVRLMLPEETDPLHKLSIIPRGRSLGVTHAIPEKEKYTTTKQEMLASIMALLGGRTAEELVFGKITTGAYSDFKNATEIARNMVCTFGMSDLGPVVYSQQHGDFAYSQKTAERIDGEVQRIIDSCNDKTVELLTANRDKLDTLAEALLEKETMYAGEVYELLGIEPRQEFSFVQ